MKINQCPFCRKDDAVSVMGSVDDNPYVMCSHCLAEGPTAKDDEAAIQIWNNATENDWDARVREAKFMLESTIAVIEDLVFKEDK